MPRPDGIVDFEPSPEYFPFESRWFDSPVGPVHYIDEGEGRPLLLMHGNPDWSFLYRKIVTGLEGRFRCVVPDYPGFGLSVHPPAPYGYTPGKHAAVVRELVEQLDLQDAVVMCQDWGGPIGMEQADPRRPVVAHRAGGASEGDVDRPADRVGAGPEGPGLRQQPEPRTLAHHVP